MVALKRVNGGIGKGQLKRGIGQWGLNGGIEKDEWGHWKVNGGIKGSMGGIG